ncbi:18902_t:CDS:2, partial [Racocetra fulgida]
SFINAEANDIEISEYIYSMEYNDEEVVPDNDELDSEDDREFTYSLNKNQTFRFAFCITHSENDKTDQQPRRRKTNGCPFYVNLYRWKNNNQICISSIVGNHSHEIVENVIISEPRYRRLTKEIQDDICLLTSCGVQAGAIVEVLRGDAGSTYLKLIKKQQDKPGYYVDARFEGIDNHLVTDMLQKYPDCTSYLERQLYSCRKTWALCYMHRSFNTGVQTTQQVESYNNIIKRHVNGTSFLFELSNVIERLLIKEDRYQRFNEVEGVLLNIYNEDYYCKYFKAVDESCQKFLTTAILKIQRQEINHSIHYRAHLTNLEDEVGIQSTDNTSTRMFTEDMYDAFVIELEQLVLNLDHAHINEPTFYTCETDMGIMSEPAISTVVNEQFESFKHNLHVNFAHLDDIRGSYVFTNKVRNEMSLKKQWGEGFGIMKKTLDLAISIRRYDELYEMHINLSKEMEIELITNNGRNILDNDDPVEFVITINNPIGISSKACEKMTIRKIKYNYVANSDQKLFG